MMKKYIMCCFFMLLIICTNSFAQNIEDNEYFSIQIPNGYQITQQQIQDEALKSYEITDSGDLSLTIDVYKNDERYTNYNIDEELLEGYEKEIQDTYKQMGVVGTTIRKEITTFTEKDYRCLSIGFLIKEHGLYQQQYITFSSNYLYVITITSSNERDISSTDVIDKFVIKDNVTNEPNYVFDISSLLIDIIITIVVYLTIPLFLRFVLHKRYNKENSKYISIWNSVFGYIFYIFLFGILKTEGVPNIGPTLLYGWISYKILHDIKLDNEVIDN